MTTNTFDGTINHDSNVSSSNNPFENKPILERSTKVRRAYGKMSNKVKRNLPWFKNTSTNHNLEETNNENKDPNTNIAGAAFEFGSPSASYLKQNKKGIILSSPVDSVIGNSQTSKTNRLIFSPYSGNKNNNKCFSKLAESGEIDSVWKNQVENYESGDIFKQHQPEGALTPKMKLASKKRGVCTSPAVESADGSLMSWSEHKINSGKSYRCRSRSRLFSPNSVEKINAKSIAKPALDRSQSAVTFSEYRKSESDDDKNAQNLSEIMDDFSTNSEDDDQPHNVVLPPKPRRKSSPDLVKSIFGTRHPTCWKDDDGKDISYVTEKSLSPLPSSVCNSSNHRNNSLVLPSDEDQKYLMKILFKHKRGRRKQVFLGNTSCTVALPCTWSAERKAIFMQWSKSIGFTIRAAGGNDTYLQTSVDKSTEILKYLEESLLSKKNRKKDKPIIRSQTHSVHFEHNDDHNLTLMSVEENLPLSYIEIPCEVGDKHTTTVDADLLKNLSDLKIDNNTESSFALEYDKKKHEFKECISPPYASSRLTNEQITPKDATYNESLRLPRLSGEQVKRNELAMHLYDMISPINNINPTKTLLLDSNEKSMAACSRAELSFEMMESKAIALNDVSFSSASVGKVNKKNMVFTPCVGKPNLINLQT